MSKRFGDFHQHANGRQLGLLGDEFARGARRPGSSGKRYLG
jgi:hypothetical protein